MNILSEDKIIWILLRMNQNIKEIFYYYEKNGYLSQNGQMKVHYLLLV